MNVQKKDCTMIVIAVLKGNHFHSTVSNWTTQLRQDIESGYVYMCWVLLKTPMLFSMAYRLDSLHTTTYYKWQGQHQAWWVLWIVFAKVFRLSRAVFSLGKLSLHNALLESSSETVDCHDLCYNLLLTMINLRELYHTYFTLQLSMHEFNTAWISWFTVLHMYMYDSVGMMYNDVII